jgi:hypothetical protein
MGWELVDTECDVLKWSYNIEPYYFEEENEGQLQDDADF